MDSAEQIRRDFAAGWAKIGAAWGVTPSTAAIQGYLLAKPLLASALHTHLDRQRSHARRALTAAGGTMPVRHHRRSTL